MQSHNNKNSYKKQKKIYCHCKLKFINESSDDRMYTDLIIRPIFPNSLQIFYISCLAVILQTLNISNFNS